MDVVHVHNLFPLLSPAVLRAASDAGARVVVTLHNYRLLCLPATLLRDEAICESCVGHTPWRGVVHRCYRGSVSGSAALASSLALHRGLRTFDRVDLFLAVWGYNTPEVRASVRDDTRIHWLTLERFTDGLSHWRVHG